MRARGSAFRSSPSIRVSCAFTPGELTVLPAGSVTTGTSGELSPPVPKYFFAIATFVSQPSLLGTENSGSSARDAGPAAAKPAIVRTTQAAATSRLWASTQRVRDDIAGGSFSSLGGSVG